jgi:hypothetical protein
MNPGILGMIIIVPLPCRFCWRDSYGKGGSDKENRPEFYVIVQMRPEKGSQGAWVISSRALQQMPGQN